MSRMTEDRLKYRLISEGVNRNFADLHARWIRTQGCCDSARVKEIGKVMVFTCPEHGGGDNEKTCPA